MKDHNCFKEDFFFFRDGLYRYACAFNSKYGPQLERKIGESENESDIDGCSYVSKVGRGITACCFYITEAAVVKMYAEGRLKFLEKLKQEIPLERYEPPEELARTVWGVRFRTPIMNAAGMFKNGECYDMVAMQGAGAYVGGTGT
jgi:hypothetical protein